MKLIFTILFFIFFALHTFAQEIVPNVGNALFFTRKVRSVQVPFRFVSNLIVIPLTINKSDTMRFILDTGVKTTLIIGTEYIDSLHLVYTRKLKVRGLGIGEDIEAYHSSGNRIDIQSIRGYNHEILILLQDIFFLSSKLGMQVHGIIGYDMFKNFIVEIDYEKRFVTFHDPKRYKKKVKGAVIPFYLQDDKPYIVADVQQEDGSLLKTKLIVDTGASHALSLDMFSDSLLKLPSKTIDAYLGKGLNGDIFGKIGRMKNINIGGYLLKDLPTSYPDSSSMLNVLRLVKRNGSIGSDILKRFHVTFNYMENKIILRPNSTFNAPFYYNMSGIEVATPIPGLPLFAISNVAEDSPAKDAGLQKGDEIISINNRSAFQYTLNDVVDLFQSKPGRRIVIRVKRDGKTIKAEFVLKKPI